MIEAADLTKFYGPVRGVEGLTFTLPQGAICGLLGPNGAGKSTTIRMLTGFMPPTRGSATLAGHPMQADSRAARAAIGYLPETNPLYPELRADEHLHLIGQLHGMSRAARKRRITDLVPQCALEQIIHRPVGQLSKGNRQRVGLACALIHQPPVLILDEPTSGLDPKQMAAFRDLIFSLKGNHTVLISSHYIPQLEQAADRVMIIAAGRLVADGTPEDLRARAASGGLLLEVQTDASTLKQTLAGLPGTLDILEADNRVRARLIAHEGQDLRSEVARLLAGAHIPLLELRSASATLEDFFAQTVAAAEVAA